MEMKFGSLFAGIGGIDLGLERAGMTCEWQVEIDPFCQEVLAKHWPEVARYEDIKEVGSHNLSPVDLICGGFPCQPHSFAGRRNASEDERDLWGEMFRVICEVKPRWVLAENVPGLLSSEAGRFFGRVLRDLASVGYDVEWESVPAAAVGAPHRRDRVFIVAYTRYAEPSRRDEATGCKKAREDSGDEMGDELTSCGDVANTISSRVTTDRGFRGRNQERIQGRPRTSSLSAWEEAPHAADVEQGSALLANTNSEGSAYDCEMQARGKCFSWWHSPSDSSWWDIEPDVGRVANGVPSRVDRLRSLGNAVVPQVAEWVGRQIVSCQD